MVDEIGRGLHDGAQVGACAVRGTRTVHVKSHVAHPEHPIEGELDAGNDAENEREAHANELTLLVEPRRHVIAMLVELGGHGLHELLELVDLTGQLVHLRTKVLSGRGRTGRVGIVEHKTLTLEHVDDSPGNGVKIVGTRGTFGHLALDGRDMMLVLYIQAL